MQFLTRIKKTTAILILGIFSFVTNGLDALNPSARNIKMDQKQIFSPDHFKTNIAHASHSTGGDNSDCKGCDIGPSDGADSGTGGGDVGCFPAGTLVLMADNSTKAIEDITIGDLVMAYDRNGELHPGEVYQLFMHDAVRLVKLNDLITTDDHRFLTSSGEFVAVCNLHKDQMIITADGDEVDWQRTELNETATVYNFEVAKYHTYIAGGYRVHNIK